MTEPPESPSPGPAREDVTALLRSWRNGDQSALESLIPIVHAELHRLARLFMSGERREHTLQTTALVNEAYMRLVNLSRVEWQDRTHFFAMSARLMRRVLIDHARSRRFAKRGGGLQRMSLDEALLVSDAQNPDLIALDQALSALAELDPRKAQVVELRYFGGLDASETAEILQVSYETVMRDWRLAKAWLLRALSTLPPLKE